MARVTRYLNFVAPNKEVLIKFIKPKIDSWIETRTQESLRNITIRLTTAIAIRDAATQGNEAWLIIYNLNKGTEPIKNIE